MSRAGYSTDGDQWDLIRWRAMAAEVMYENDEGSMRPETPEQRWQRIRSWAISEMSAETLLPEPPEEPKP